MIINRKSFETVAECVSPGMMMKKEAILQLMTADAYERCYEDGKTIHNNGYVLSCKDGVVSARVSDYFMDVGF